LKERYAKQKVRAIEKYFGARDKKHARKGERRVPEFTLFMLTILGGFIGALCGMYIFRHKTRKWYFSFGIPLIAFLETGLILFLIFS